VVATLEASGGVDLRLWVSFFAVVFVGCFVLGRVCVAADEVAAQDTITEAEASLRNAFGHVLDAEAAGANVSNLMAELMLGGSLLTSAEGNLSLGNVSAAYDGAVACKNMADGVATNADALKSHTVAAAGWWLTAGMSAIGSCVFLLVLAVLWRLFKQHHREEQMRKRPKVVD
jgi:hypothetical protein